MTRIFPKRPKSLEEKATIFILSGDAISAFQTLNGRPRSESEAFIVDLAESIILGEVETADGKDGFKKAILPPNSIIGILRTLRTINGEEKKRLAKLFFTYCEKHNWPGIQLKIFQLPGMESDLATRRAIEEKIINRITYKVAAAVTA